MPNVNWVHAAVFLLLGWIAIPWVLGMLKGVARGSN